MWLDSIMSAFYSWCGVTLFECLYTCGWVVEALYCHLVVHLPWSWSACILIMSTVGTFTCPFVVYSLCSPRREFVSCTHMDTPTTGVDHLWAEASDTTADKLSWVLDFIIKTAVSAQWRTFARFYFLLFYFKHDNTVEMITIHTKRA